MITDRLPGVALLLGLLLQGGPDGTACLLCGNAVPAGPRFPFTFAGLRVAFCPDCDGQASTDRKLLAVARALDDRSLTRTAE